MLKLKIQVQGCSIETQIQPKDVLACIKVTNEIKEMWNIVLTLQESLMKKSTFGIDERDEEDVEVGEKRKNTEGGCSQHF